MPALVQVDDDRHRVLDLLFDGVEWVLHAPERALQRALSTLGHVQQLRFVRGLPTPKTRSTQRPTIPHQPHNRTQHKICMCALPRTRTTPHSPPALHRVRIIPTVRGKPLTDHTKHSTHNLS